MHEIFYVIYTLDCHQTSSIFSKNFRRMMMIYQNPARVGNNIVMNRFPLTFGHVFSRRAGVPGDHPSELAQVSLVGSEWSRWAGSERAVSGRDCLGR